MPQKPSLFAEPADEEPRPPVAEPAAPRAFIPPQPERAATRSAPRMPTFEELPVPVQNEFRAKRGEPTDMEHPEKRRLTLLQRLAAVGLGRREDELEQKPEVRSADHHGGQPNEHRRGRPDSPNHAVRSPDTQGEAIPKVSMSTAGGAAAPAPADDDQLDIPAFLRRQAN